MRKVWEHAGLVHERIYLGGYEIWREHTGSISSPPSPDEERQTLHISDDARRVCMVETLTVTGGSPVGSPTPRFRYQYDNHLGTTCVEADTSGAVISYEEYHPYGTSSYRSFTSSEVSDKRYRYTGKERDEETSLYYHGARYYAPWLGRWMSADPAGTVDGTNLYAYVRGSPIGLVDPNGMQGHASFEQEIKPAAEPDDGSVVEFSPVVITAKAPAPDKGPKSYATKYNYAPNVESSKPWTPPEVVKESYGHQASVAGDPSKTSLERAYAAVEAVRLLPQAGAEAVVHGIIATPQLAVQLPVEAGERATRAGVLYRKGSTSAAADELLHAQQVEAEGAAAVADTVLLAHAAGTAAKAGVTRVVEAAKGAIENVRQQGRLVSNVLNVSGVPVKPAGVGGYNVGPYKDVGSHHIIQEAAVRDLPGYSRRQATAVDLGNIRDPASPHRLTRPVQRQAGGGTYAAERRIGYKALRRAGVSESAARKMIGRADAYFESIGVGRGTPTRIPGDRF